MDPAVMNAPNTDTTQPPPAQGAGAQGWSQAAGGPGAMPKAPTLAPAAPPMTTEHDTSLDQQQIQPKQVTAIQAPPQDAVRVPRKGLAGFVDKIADTLAGTDTSKVRTDSDGNLYIEHSTPTRGQQWLKIAAEAMIGAGAGMAAGRGQGRQGNALMAGVEQGRQIQQNQSEQEKEQQLEVANSQALKHQAAVQAFQLQDMQRKGTEEDITFSQAQADRMKSQGAEVVAHVNSPADMFKFMRETPNFNQDQVQQNLYTPVKTYDADGKPSGMDIYRTVPGHGDEILPAGTEFHVWDPVEHKMSTQKTTSPRKTSEVNALNMAAGNASDKWALEQANINEKNASAQEKINPVTKPLTPEEAALKKAETARAWAEANSAQATADEKKAKSANQGELVDQIGQGKMVPGRLSYLLARNPELLTAVADKYPDFDSSKVEAYAATYKDFTEGKTAQQLNAGATALGHMEELRQLNTTKSHIPFSSDWTAYQNKVDTLATELAKFYGDATIPAIQAIKKTLGSTLPGNRDAAIKTQAESMLDKFASFEQQWKNAAPSKSYQAAMPGISPKAQEARAALQHAYKTNLQTNGMVTVQIPGHPPGQIPAANLTKFLRDNPGAQKVQ